MKKSAKYDDKIVDLRLQGLSYEKIKKTLLEEDGEIIALKTVQLKCKRLFKERGLTEPILIKGRRSTWNIGEESEKLNERIFELKQQGKSYKNIVKILSEEGIETNLDKVSRLCRNIYAEKGKTIPKVSETSPIDRDEMFTLSQKGYSNTKLLQVLHERGIENITISRVNNIIKSIYEEHGLKRNSGRQTIELPEDEIYNLKMQGYSVADVFKYFKQKGMSICESTVYKRIVKVFEEKDEEMPIADARPMNRIKIPEEYHEKIYELREKGKSIQEIIIALREEDGIKTSRGSIERVLKKIYEEKGKTQPKAKVGRKLKSYKHTANKKIEQFADRIYELREQGYAVEEIRRILAEECEFSTSLTAIAKKLKEIYANKGKEQPRTSRKRQISDIVCKLREEGLKYEDIVLKLEIEYGIHTHKYTVEHICKEEYGHLTGKQLKKLRELQKARDELSDLRVFNKKSVKLLEEYERLLQRLPKNTRGERDE